MSLEIRTKHVGQKHRFRRYLSNVLFAILLLGVIDSTSAITPYEIEWTDHFGVDRRNPAVFYSLLSFGFFRADLSGDFAAVKNGWLVKHPNAVVIPVVTRGQFNERIRNSKLVVIWITDKDDSLNVELVRRGCVRASTMFASRDDKLQVSRKQYEEFVQHLIAAEELAKREQIGIWTWPRSDADRTDD